MSKAGLAPRPLSSSFAPTAWMTWDQLLNHTGAVSSFINESDNTFKFAARAKYQYIAAAVCPSGLIIPLTCVTCTLMLVS